MPNKNITRLVVGPIETNCWIYPLDEKNAAVIDPGDEEALIISALNELKLNLTYILLTHGHFDHIMAVPHLVNAFDSKRPQIAIHRLDSEYLGPEAYKAHEKSLKAAMGSVFLEKLKVPMPQADCLLEEGDKIGNLTVLSLPGHTQGSAAFWDKDEGVLFTGDTLFEGAYGRTDLPGGNEKQIYESLRRLFAMDENIKVYPGHGEITGIGKEKRSLKI